MKEKGMSEDEITTFMTNLTKNNFTRVYSEAMSVFTEEDLTAIDAVTDQAEANTVIAATYKERTGKEVVDEMQKFLDVFCDGFLEEYEKEKAGQGAVSATVVSSETPAPVTS